MLVIDAWNEWLEGSVIEPDTYWRCGYLEQVAAVFGSDRGRRSRNTIDATPASRHASGSCDGAASEAAVGSPSPTADRRPAAFVLRTQR
ncbi:MAG: glycoside hydrolase family 99-like domain-containing protein [Chloroflexota bacterium]|nr:glycoside hydrolase family 99-like domain-containing protein [Chloroflexota bacterium]